MKRREFIAALGGAAAWPLVARAQQPSQVRHIGLLLGVAEEQDPESQARIEAFRGGLAALGWIEGQNIKIDYRFGGGDADRIKTYATELVNSGPDLIVANSTPAVAALKRATQTIPVVFAVVSDPVGQGLIANLAHPGGNITGFTLIDFEMVGKWYEMLKEMTPGIKRAMLIFNPETAPDYPTYLRELAAISADRIVGLKAAPVHDRAGLQAAVTALASGADGGLITAADAFTVAHRALIMSLAEQYRVPAVYQFRQFAVEGGLMSYGPDTADIFRRSAAYVDRILKGATPTDLPAQAPTKFELVINLKTAKAIGLQVPPQLLARADEVIE